MKNVVRDKDGECIHIGEWGHDIQPVVNENAEDMTLGEARAMEADNKNPDHSYDEKGKPTIESIDHHYCLRNLDTLVILSSILTLQIYCPSSTSRIGGG